MLLFVVMCALAAPAHAGLIVAPRLSLSACLIDPGQATTATAAFFSDGVEKHLATLVAPRGFVVSGPDRDMFLDGEHGQVINWHVSAGLGVRRGRYPLGLYVDGAFVDSISVDVRGFMVYLPMLREK